MPGLFQGLEIGKRALLSHQYTLQTIGHNIANVNTPGYTRQRVTISATPPEVSTLGSIGTGVSADDIRQIKDLFLGDQYREAAKSHGQWTYKQKTLSQIESVFNEPQDQSLNALLNQFWDSWSQLSTNSDSASNRKLVVTNAQQLVNGVNTLAQKLHALRASIDRDMTTMIDDINRLTSEIAQINAKIQVSEVGGQKANDLRDARDLLTDELAKLIDVRTVEKENGGTLVTMGSMILVDGDSQMPIVAKPRNDEGQPVHDIAWKNTSVILQNRSGQLSGLMEARDKIIPQYIDQLDEIARTLVRQVNNLHQSGYDQKGNAGMAFFDPNFTSALTLRLTSVVTNDASRVVAASAPEGNNEIALSVSDLRNNKIMNNGTLTINDFYSSLVGTLGVEAQEAESFTENYELLIQQVESRRQAVQGVSLDEEMASMVKFQHAYDAAARVITTMDQALDTVINGMGVVGR